MPIFSSPTSQSRTLFEARVIQIDPATKTYRVYCFDGNVLPEVTSLYGVAPALGDKVLLTTGTGRSLIIGVLSKPGITEEGFSVGVAGNQHTPPTGNYSSMSRGASVDVDDPLDTVPQDQVTAGPLGNMVALLRGGSLVLRASRVSEIFLSPFRGLVRVVARQWEHFTDSFSDVAYSRSDRSYRFTGYGTTTQSNSSGAYVVREYFGDVALAEGLEDRYFSVTSTPAASNVIYKQKMTLSDGQWRRAVSVNSSGEEQSLVTDGTVQTRRTVTSASIEMTFNEKQKITIDGTNISIVHESGATLTLSSSGIDANFSGAKVQLVSAGVHVEFESGAVDITSGFTKASFGSHSVTISPSGVALA